MTDSPKTHRETIPAQQFWIYQNVLSKGYQAFRKNRDWSAMAVFAPKPYHVIQIEAFRFVEEVNKDLKAENERLKEELEQLWEGQPPLG